MNTLFDLLCHTVPLHPEMEIPDYIKLIYQSLFGPGHLTADPDRALAALQAELAGLPSEAVPAGAPAVELCGPYARLPLDPAQLHPEDLPLLLRCMLLSVEKQRPRGGRDLWEALGCLTGLVLSGAFSGKLFSGAKPIDPAALENFLAQYDRSGCPPIHHSQTYREFYHPHYRVLSRDLALSFPALLSIDRALRSASGPVTVAVDGLAAAGKTTFAQLCRRLFGDCSLFHMDDFFLPPEKRLPERLAEPGGNVDYERALEELFLPLSRGEAVALRKFDCKTNTFQAPVGVPCSALNLIEGSYAHHPLLAPYSQVKLFFTCDSAVQAQRLRRRETPESYERFLSRWLPMERLYFEGLDIMARADVVIDSTLFCVQDA